MKQRFAILFIMLTLSVLVFAENAFDCSIQPAIEVFEEHVVKMMEEHQVPGLAVVVTKDGKTVFMKALGYKDRDKTDLFTVDTLFHIASNTKMLTAIAIMQLFEKGIIDLDAPLIQYLPWFKQNDPMARFEKITIRQLLNHTAGISRAEGAVFYDIDQVALTGKLPSSDEVMMYAMQQRMVADPGTRLKYSNLGYLLLGHVIAQCGGIEGEGSDERYANYMKQNILDPLDLKNSGFVIEATKGDQFATPYGDFEVGTQIRLALPLVLNPGCISAGWGMYSSTTDLNKLLIWLTSAFQGQSAPLLRPETMALMTANPVKDPFSNDQYALGIVMTESENGPIWGHAGGFFGYLSHVNVELNSGVGVAILLNTANVNSQKYVDLVYRTFGNALIGLPPKIPETTPPKKDETKWFNSDTFKNVTGRYHNPVWGEFSIAADSEGMLIYDIKNRKLPMQFIEQTSNQIVFRLGWEAHYTKPIGDYVYVYLDRFGAVEKLIPSNTTEYFRVEDILPTFSSE